MTDALKVIAENTMHIAGGNEITVRYYDLITPSEDSNDDRTADDVISDIRNKLSNM